MCPGLFGPGNASNFLPNKKTLEAILKQVQVHRWSSCRISPTKVMTEISQSLCNTLLDRTIFSLNGNSASEKATQGLVPPYVYG